MFKSYVSIYRFASQYFDYSLSLCDFDMFYFHVKKEVHVRVAEEDSSVQISAQYARVFDSASFCILRVRRICSDVLEFLGCAI